MTENVKLILLVFLSISLTIFCVILAYRKVKKRQKLTESEQKKQRNKDNEKEGIAYLMKGILENITMLFK